MTRNFTSTTYVVLGMLVYVLDGIRKTHLDYNRCRSIGLLTK